MKQTDGAIVIRQTLIKHWQLPKKQIKAIKRLMDEGRFGTMPEKLREMALLRLDNPDATLTELGEMLKPPLKKAGVNSRLKRIEAMADNDTERKK